MLLCTELPYLGRLQSPGQGFDEKKERKATESFFQVTSVPTRQTGEAGHNVGTELLRGRSPLCGQRESVVGKTNFDVGTKKWVGQGTTPPQCALQMRSAIGTDILDGGDRFTGERAPSYNTLPKNIRKDDQKVTCVYKNLCGV